MKVDTPELDRFLAAIEPRKVNDVLSEFLDWLEESGLALVRQDDAIQETRTSCPNSWCWVGVDRSKMTPRERQVFAERRGILEWQERFPCDTCRGTGYVVDTVVREAGIVRFPRKAAVIADFLGLDEDKMEDERRALLAGLREEAA